MNGLGPIYGVPLIDELPLSGGMFQAMPSRDDLIQVKKISQRTVAGYEVLMHKWTTRDDGLKIHLLATYRRLMVERDNYQLDGLSGRLIQGEMLGLAGVWLFVTGKNDLAERAKT